MSDDLLIQGTLFAEDLLRESVVEIPDWERVDDDVLEGLESELRKIFERFPTQRSPNETTTEDELIWPVLQCLGWTDFLRQQNLSQHGREDVPDGILFADSESKALASNLPEEWRCYEHGLVMVESKRWLRPLDRASKGSGTTSAPSTQMLRYLRRVDDLTSGKLRWGILTNGTVWRLYYAGARSVSEQFFELDLAALLGIAGREFGLFSPSSIERRHWLRVFVLVFRRESFLPGAADERTFHQRAIEEGRFHEQRVAASLSNVVFERVFPNLARAIAKEAPDAPLSELRDSTLVLLYRLLFILYAEDRNLLPVRDAKYDDYALREKVRKDVGARKDRNDTFSVSAARYWSAIDDLCRAIDQGDESIGLPPYNGGLFDQSQTPLLSRIRLGDLAVADVIDALSFEQTDEGRRYINYRDLGVQQLGSIYERLLEQEVVREDGKIQVRPNIFARKDSGSYYTPDDLVSLIVRETIEPLAQVRLDNFADEVSKLNSTPLEGDEKLEALRKLDPAEKLLELKVCDPAMGSGHFLVNLVDHLTDHVIRAIAEAESLYDGYVSPLNQRIEHIRGTIMGNAAKRGWSFDSSQLDDRHIVRRMVLKRCVYGVDKNPMAVELAKVSLWLHTFTVGAPLSFLDHHLRCGNSLFGSWVHPTLKAVGESGGAMFLEPSVKKAMPSASSMREIEEMTDAEIAEAHRSAKAFAGLSEMTVGLDAFLSLFHALAWLDPSDSQDKAAYRMYLDGIFGDPVEIAEGNSEVSDESELAVRFLSLLDRARELVSKERFLNWQIAFPGVWTEWGERQLQGGFDAVIGNPPWDRLKLQRVEYFSVRRPEIAKAPRASDRNRLIAELQDAGDPLADDYFKANYQTGAALRMAREGGDYPLLSGGDVNLYSLFVERAMTLVNSSGMIGLLVPSGIASDKFAAPFFKRVATEGRLKALYDFENRRTRYQQPPFFPDVDTRFKFCVFVASHSSQPDSARCGFFLQDVSELDDSDRCFHLSAKDFARVNPNTGTAPIFRSLRDRNLTTAIYDRLPVLVDRSSGDEVKTWPVKYTRMFDMANDSRLFRTRAELIKEGAWPIGGNRYNSSSGEWAPLYEGKMVQAFNHRAAGVKINPDNLNRQGLPDQSSASQLTDPEFAPNPRYFVQSERIEWKSEYGWSICFKDITSPTNMRSMIATVLPTSAAGHKLPYLFVLGEDGSKADLLLGNLNSIIFDYCARQKVNTNSFTLFLLEQLPVVHPESYESIRFGSKTSGEIVREAVLELTYTAHDLAAFARDMGYVNDVGDVLPPFLWDEDRRLYLRAKLDAVYFQLYGVTDHDDIRHVYSTFPIVEEEEMGKWGAYRSRDLCIAWVNALAAGETEADIQL